MPRSERKSSVAGKQVNDTVLNEIDSVDAEGDVPAASSKSAPSSFFRHQDEQEEEGCDGRCYRAIPPTAAICSWKTDDGFDGPQTSVNQCSIKSAFWDDDLPQAPWEHNHTPSDARSSGGSAEMLPAHFPMQPFSGAEAPVMWAGSPMPHNALLPMVVAPWVGGAITAPIAAQEVKSSATMRQTGDNFCMFCGLRFSEDDKFCGQCGSRRMLQSANDELSHAEPA